MVSEEVRVKLTVYGLSTVDRLQWFVLNTVTRSYFTLAFIVQHVECLPKIRLYSIVEKQKLNICSIYLYNIYIKLIFLKKSNLMFIYLFYCIVKNHQPSFLFVCRIAYFWIRIRKSEKRVGTRKRSR